MFDRKEWCLLLITMVAVLVTGSIYLAQHSARGDYIPYIGVKLSEEPLICVFEPLVKDVQFHERDLFYQTAKAIKNWEDKLNERSAGNWDMKFRYYSTEEHADKEVDAFPDCNIYIVYTQYAEDSRRLGSTSFDYSKSWHKYAFIEIITDMRDIKSKVINKNDTNTNIVLTLNERQLNSDVIGQIITHELGHALGLEHYVDDTSENYGEDIMKANIDDTVYNEDIVITPADIEALIQLYGEDGFGGRDPLKQKQYDVLEKNTTPLRAGR